ncbi:hypothetical protein DRW03_30580 [Corallococcus sp. H22C18031201]|nr:hypothetical protein DRW03_30580 [Corallococcus sp. H22C18031201]
MLVKGGLGLGKSALLTEWLRRREAAGQRVPHHFLQHGVEDRDRPEVVKRNLAAQTEKLYPELVDSEARPESRLSKLLVRVSQVLGPRQEQLVLMVDGLDEVEEDADGSNPLSGFLPPTLPPGVKVLCASRPTYPHLSWLEARDGLRTIDLDDERWARSNRQVVREYWARERVSSRFNPPLAQGFVEEVVQRAEGNILYSVKLAEWLETQPVEKRQAELLPRGLEALLDESWERIQKLAPELRGLAEEGLGVMAVARDALPRSILSDVAGWRAMGEPDRFLRVARSFLLEEVAPGRNEKAWRPFHESFRRFVLTKLGAERARVLHSRMAGKLCQWPVGWGERGFRRSYALRHGVTHLLKAEQWDQARKLYTDMGYLEKRCHEAGVLSVEEALKSAVVEVPEPEQELARALLRAIQAGSHVLKRDAKALPLHVYNWLRCGGWERERLEKELGFPEGMPELRLRHPVRAGAHERTLEGHKDGVNGCVVTPDGRYVVSASADGTLKVWEVETGREVATLKGHKGEVTGCAVTPDGRRVVSTSGDRTLKVWQVETGQEVATLKGHEGEVTCCAVTPDGGRVVSASEDKTLKVWEVKTGREVATLKGHEGRVRGCVVTPDGLHVVSTSVDKTLRVWEVETGREVTVLKGHEDKVRGCAVTPDGRHVVSASEDKTLKVWEVKTGREVATLKGHKGKVRGCAVTPDGRHVVSTSDDGTLKLWEAETGREVATLEGHWDWVNGCAVTPDGRRVVSASGDKTLKVWQVETGQEVATLKGHESWVTGCAVTPDGRCVVSASDDRTLRVWEVETGREVAVLKGHEDKVRGCAVTPDGRHVVSASEDGMLKVWEVKTGREVATLKGHQSWVNGCAVTPDGRHVVSASADGTLKVWAVETWQEVATLKGHQSWVNGCAVTPDGRRVVSASEDGTLKVWEVETGREVATLKCHEEGVTGCAVTPDGGRVVSASASDDGTLRVWAVETGREVAVLKGHEDKVRGCAVTPDGRRVVSASEDGTLKVWDLRSGQCLYTLHGFNGFLTVAIGPDFVCAGDVRGNVWILETGSSVARTLVDSNKATSPVTPTPMTFSFPPPLLDAYRSKKLALCTGSGLSLSKGVQGNFPTWPELPQRFLDACERQGVLDAEVIVAKRAQFKRKMRLEVMLAELGTLVTALDRSYQDALNDIFRPPDVAPGVVHNVIAQLGVGAILTTNYDPLIEELRETPRRQPYTWKEAERVLGDLKAGRRVLFKIHGTAERYDTVVITEREYDRVRSDKGYQSVLRHLLQENTVLFLGYGMNDPFDIDLVLKWNADVFNSAARRHYALLKDPSDTDSDRYLRDYNIQVLPYSDYAALPGILEALKRADP